MNTLVIFALLSPLATASDHCALETSAVNDTIFTKKEIVTSEAMGARCVVSADFTGNGLMDLVSASSTDNQVAWYENKGGMIFEKHGITYASNGARIVTTGDVDGDGDQDIIVASYYDNTLRWFENLGPRNDTEGPNQSPKSCRQQTPPTPICFAEHIVTTTAINAQGVTSADIDGDGDLDLITASSGDNTVAWYENLANGVFCDIKKIVDANAIGVRTPVAADFDGDGTVDLASASKDDNTIAWYPNLDGKGTFPTKNLINTTAHGAYSAVAADVDKDGCMDLVVACNGHGKDHQNMVAWYKNDCTGNFEFHEISTITSFALSVYAADFDGDGDIDVASASYFDGRIAWYKNSNGDGTVWEAHTLNLDAGHQGHYVYADDLDGDGDDDLLAVTMAENRITVYEAQTHCDAGFGDPTCCRMGQQYNGTHCVACPIGTYGPGCVACPVGPAACGVDGWIKLPDQCYGITGCADREMSTSMCVCAEDNVFDTASQVCQPCAEGLNLGAGSSYAVARTFDDIVTNGSSWFPVECNIPIRISDNTSIIAVAATGSALCSA